MTTRRSHSSRIQPSAAEISGLACSGLEIKCDAAPCFHSALLLVLGCVLAGAADASSRLPQLAQAQPAPAAPDPPRQCLRRQPRRARGDAPAAAIEPIGNVGTLTGTATVIRNKNSLPLQLQDDMPMIP